MNDVLARLAELVDASAPPAYANTFGAGCSSTLFNEPRRALLRAGATAS